MQTFMRFIFSLYMLLLVVCFGLVLVDPRSGPAPMSGTMAILGSYVAGLPWTDIAAHAVKNGNVDDVVFHAGWIGAAANVFVLGYLSGFWLAGTGDRTDVDAVAPGAQGYCPNCGIQLPGTAPECTQCGAMFGPESEWRLLRAPKDEGRTDA